MGCTVGRSLSLYFFVMHCPVSRLVSEEFLAMRCIVGRSLSLYFFSMRRPEGRLIGAVLLRVRCAIGADLLRMRRDPGRVVGALVFFRRYRLRWHNAILLLRSSHESVPRQYHKNWSLSQKAKVCSLGHAALSIFCRRKDAWRII